MSSLLLPVACKDCARLTNGANPVPPPKQTILLSSSVPSGFLSSSVKLPTGFIQTISSPSFALKSCVVRRPGKGFRTHLMYNSIYFLFSEFDAMEYALRIILFSLGTCIPIVMNWPDLYSGTGPSCGT